MFSRRLLAIPFTALISLVVVSPVAAASSKIDLGRFQPAFEIIRPYLMLGFLALGLYVIVHRLWKAIGGILKSSSEGQADHKTGVLNLFSAIAAVLILEVAAYGVLWFGLDAFNAALDFIKTVSASAN